MEERCIKVYSVEPTAVNLPYARSLIVVEKKSTKNGAVVKSTRYYLSSRPPSSGCAQYFAEAIRGHWSGCEINNHWVRDALWEEDKTRSKNWKINANLAILRATLIKLKSTLAETSSWPEIFEKCQRYPSVAYQLVSNNRFK